MRHANCYYYSNNIVSNRFLCAQSLAYKTEKEENVYIIIMLARIFFYFTLLVQFGNIYIYIICIYVPTSYNSRK